jgi:2-methylcitrate dehydratase PrpD
MAEKCIVDTVGVVLGGADEPASRIVREQVADVTTDAGASIPSG